MSEIEVSDLKAAADRALDAIAREAGFRAMCDPDVGAWLSATTSPNSRECMSNPIMAVIAVFTKRRKRSTRIIGTLS
jgi:hypothetical protein